MNLVPLCCPKCRHEETALIVRSTSVISLACLTVRISGQPKSRRCHLRSANEFRPLKLAANSDRLFVPTSAVIEIRRKIDECTAVMRENHAVRAR